MCPHRNMFIAGFKLQTNMEALRTEPIAEGETPVSSVQVVSQVLSKSSSNIFLSVGIKAAVSSEASSANESELREQLAAEARAAVQTELDELKNFRAEAREKMERQQKEMEEMKKRSEITNKALEENNVLSKRLLSINSTPST
jgi:molecular chaperone GrpE (heat shock protein)